MPLGGVAGVGQAREDDREVAATFFGRALEQTVDVLEDGVAGLLEVEEAVNVPPQDALLALDAPGRGEGLRDGVVLARETAHDHVDVGNLGLARLKVVEHFMDVLVDDAARAEPRLVATSGELLTGRSRRFPLVGPDGGERARRRHVELGVVLGFITFEAQAESAHAGKELSDPNLVHRHVSP